MLSNHFSLKEASDTQDSHKSIGGLLSALPAPPGLGACCTYVRPASLAILDLPPAPGVKI